MSIISVVVVKEVDEFLGAMTNVSVSERVDHQSPVFQSILRSREIATGCSKVAKSRFMPIKALDGELGHVFEISEDGILTDHGKRHIKAGTPWRAWEVPVTLGDISPIPLKKSKKKKEE